MRTRTILALSLNLVTPVAAAQERPRGASFFAGFDWRAMYLADMPAHGFGVQAGALLANGRLKVGFYGFFRPGPINPATVTVNAAGGRSYRGSRQLTLRSDGSFIGAFVAPVVRLGERFVLEFPIAVGMSAFGSYLVGADRDTPDGRRVSAWANELFDGRDSSFAFGLEAGVRLGLRLRGAAGVIPYVGLHGHHAFGYDAFASGHWRRPAARPPRPGRPRSRRMRAQRGRRSARRRTSAAHGVSGSTAGRALPGDLRSTAGAS